MNVSDNYFELSRMLNNLSEQFRVAGLSMQEMEKELRGLRNENNKQAQFMREMNEVFSKYL